jgi:hypothetical protein
MSVTACLRRLIPLMAAAALVVTAGAAADSEPEAWHASPPTPEACHSDVIASLGAVDCTETPTDEVHHEPAAAAAVPTLDEEFSRNFRLPDDTGLPPYCRIPAQVVLYTSSDWLRLGQKLVGDASPCAEYDVSIPALAANKIGLRVVQDDLMRALGPRIQSGCGDPRRRLA